MTKKEYDMKIEKAMNRYYDTLEKCNPFNVKSKYVTYILEEHKTSDFTEIVGNIGGDVLTFRVYKDGSVYEQ